MACKVLISVAALAAVWIAVPRPVHAQETPPPAPATAPVVPSTPAALLAVLNNPSPDLPQSDRDEAARRLVAMDTPEAEDALRSALVNTGNQRGQQSVARALAEDRTPGAAYVIPLAALIGPDAASTDAGARALAHLRGDPGARRTLLSAAANRQLREPSRLAVIRALAPLATKRAAETLVDIVTGEGESASARNTAANELIEMTGLAQNGTDAQRWRQWWTDNRDKPDAEFEAEMLSARAARLDRIEPRLERLTAEVRVLLREHFQNAPNPAAREQVLVGYLRSPVSEVRQIGAGIVIDLFDSASSVPASASQQLRTMVGDSDEQVRLQVAAAVQRMNDVAALDAVLAQLAVERSPAVRAALAAALGPMGEARAVPQLLGLLKDTSPAVVEAAAYALQAIRDQLRDADPRQAAEISRALNDALRRTPPGRETSRLREQIAAALVAWASPDADVRNTFVDLLKPHESATMRRLALRYFGQMGSDATWPSDNIINSGALEDRDADVRFAAVAALGRTARAANAGLLYERLSPDVEPDAKVRDEAWKALTLLFPREFDADLLNSWADKFRDAPERRITVLETLRDKLREGGRESELAVVRQNIGETYASLEQYGRAAVEFADALNSPGRAQNQPKDYLVSQLINAHLLNKNYEEAARFGARMIGENRRYQSTIGPAMTKAAQRLAREGDAESALRLVGLALKMDPPLAGNFADQLRAIEQQLRAKVDATTAPGNAAP